MPAREGGYDYTEPSLLVATASLPNELAHVGASYTAGGTEGDAGLVFNYGSAGCAIFFVSCYAQTTETEEITMINVQLATFPTSGAGQVFTGTSTPAPTNATDGLIPWSVDLDIAATSNGLAYSCRVTWATGTTESFSITPGTGAPQSFVPGSSIGLAARRKGDVNFTRLQGVDATDIGTDLLPLGTTVPVTMRLLVRPSGLRTAGELAAAVAGAMPVRPAPEPDFSTGFVLTPAASGYYGSAQSGGGLPGIGAEQL
jgi:hypothetical protein